MGLALVPVAGTPYLGGNIPGFVSISAGGLQVVIKNNLDAASDPTVNDDSGAGYAVGSVWTTTAGKVWLCTDASVGAAVWKDLTAGGVTTLNALAGALAIAVGTSGSDVAVSPSGSTITVNIPDAGASARGVLSTGTQTIAGAKTLTGNTVLNPASPSTIPLSINLASGQTASALQITSYGGAAGDLASIAKDGTIKSSLSTAPWYMGRFSGANGAGFALDGSGNLNLLAANSYETALVAPNNLRGWSNFSVQWANKVWDGTHLVNATSDLGSGRNAAGIGEANNGTAGQYRDWIFRSIGLGVAPSGVTGGINAAAITCSAGISPGAITFAVLNATAATATLGVYRITDRANRLAYPDGTNWRFVSDDAIIS